MPQPYPKSKLPFVSIGEAVKNRPLLALNGMNVITQWSQAEMSMQLMFISMLGANPGPAASIFTTLRNNNLQREAMMTVAQDALAPNDLEIFEVIVNHYQSCARNRDKIAHHAWAIDEQFPDAVILVDPRKIAKLSADISVIIYKNKLDYDEAIEKQAIMHDACSIWKEKDFQNSAKRISRVSIMAIAFSTLLRNIQDKHEYKKSRDVLLRLPEIREALDRNAPHHKKSQSTPEQSPDEEGSKPPP